MRKRRAYHVLAVVLGLVTVVVALVPHEVSVQGTPYQCGPVVATMVPSDPGDDRDRAALEPCHSALKPYLVASLLAVLLAGGSMALGKRAGRSAGSNR